MKAENVLTAVLVLGLFFIMVSATSCTSGSGQRPSRNVTLLAPATRVKVLETRSIDYVKLDSFELKVYRALDTVWVNLATHKIESTEYATKCVLYATAQ
jgi:hypothetical protein